MNLPIGLPLVNWPTFNVGSPPRHGKREAVLDALADTLPRSGRPPSARPPRDYPPLRAPRSIVLVESPYRGHPDALRYLACCLLDSVRRGECPIASHAHLPLVADEDEAGRALGLECRDELARLFWCVRYVDLGTSPGMRRLGDYLPDRRLQGEALAIWSRGEWPSAAHMTHNHDAGAP